MKTFQSILLFLGRLFLSATFLADAAKKLIDWTGAERNFIAILSDWQSYVSAFPSLQDVFVFILTWGPEFLIGLTALELIGGLLLFLGIKVKWGASLLSIYTLIATVLFYQFWHGEAAKNEMQRMLFLQNLAILGGLFFVAVHGGCCKKKPEGNPASKK